MVPRDKAQAALAMVFPGPPRRHPDRAAAQVWAAVASGLGGRLFEALRDRRSLAYTVVASAWLKARAGALLTYIATSPEREEEAREEMLRELDRFTREPVSESELRQAVNYLAGQAEVSRQSGGAVAAEILEAWVAGQRPRRAGGSGARPSAPSPRRTCSGWPGACLDPARRAEGVVRGTARPGRPWQRCSPDRGRYRLRSTPPFVVRQLPSRCSRSSGRFPARLSGEPAAMTSTPRPTSAGARATTATKHTPRAGAVCSTMCPSRQSSATATPLGPSRTIGGPSGGMPTAPAAATTDGRESVRVGEARAADAGELVQRDS